MGKVLKVSEISDGIDQLIKKKKHEQKQLTHIKNALNQVIGLDDTLKGEGGQAIRQNFSMVHMPVLEAFDQFLEEYIQQLKDLKNKVTNYESEDGLVREHFIEHDVNNGLDKIKSIVDDSVEAINHHFSKVSDLISGPDISSDHLDSEIHKTKQDNKDTVEKLNKLDHESKSGLEGSEDSLKQVTQLVGTVKDWAKDGPFLQDLPKPSQTILNHAYKDLENGEIDRDKYFDILSVLKKTKGDLSEEELNEEVPESFIEYLNENRASLARDLGVPIGASLMQHKGSIRLGALIQGLKGIRGPKGPYSFKIINPKSARAAKPFIKADKYVRTAGKAVGRGFIGVGAAIGMYDDMHNKHMKAGEAITHNAAATGIGGGSTTVITSLLTLAVTAVIGSNPVGWAAIGIAAAGTAVGVGLTMGFNYLYDHNKLGIKDDLDYVGKKIDQGWNKAKKTVSNIVHHPGEAIKSGLNALNPFG